MIRVGDVVWLRGIKNNTMDAFGVVMAVNVQRGVCLVSFNSGRAKYEVELKYAESCKLEERPS